VQSSWVSIGDEAAVISQVAGIMSRQCLVDSTCCHIVTMLHVLCFICCC